MPTKTIKPYPAEEFYFSATPTLSPVGGINGVFYHNAGSYEICAHNYNVVRFYDDGLVIYVSVCDDESTGDFSKDIWSYISKWFSREKIDETVYQGIYHTTDNKI